MTLAQKLAKLHTTEAPPPPGQKAPMFGFPVCTYRGSTPQKNDWCVSWAHFFAENRLRLICRLVEENHGTDAELEELMDRLIRVVVPRLLENGRLGGKQGVKPVLIHGGLWRGNQGKGKFDDVNGMEPFTFNPSSCYAHSEFEFALMRAIPEFSAGWLYEYHHIVPETEPKKEYGDRMTLYEL